MGGTPSDGGGGSGTPCGGSGGGNTPGGGGNTDGGDGSGNTPTDGDFGNPNRGGRGYASMILGYAPSLFCPSCL